jgi:hypothetical protein
VIDPLYDPKPGDIGLTRIAGDVGFGIRVGQFLNRLTLRFWTWRKLWRKARYEHAFMVTRVDRDGTVWIIEAEPGGAVERLLHYGQDSILWLRAPNAVTGLLAAKKALQFKGVGYSFLDYLALFLKRLGFNFKWLRDYITSGGHMICSQLVDHIAMLAGWHLFGLSAVPPSDDVLEGDVIPEMIAELAELQPAASPLSAW